jgi:hypothetical protein
MNQEQLALRAQIEKLTAQNELMKKIATRQGFCDYYFKILPEHKTNQAAFYFLNDLYENLFGIKRYEDHHSFKSAINHYFKK